MNDQKTKYLKIGFKWKKVRCHLKSKHNIIILSDIATVMISIFISFPHVYNLQWHSHSHMYHFWLCCLQVCVFVHITILIDQYFCYSSLLLGHLCCWRHLLKQMMVKRKEMETMKRKLWDCQLTSNRSSLRFTKFQKPRDNVSVRFGCLVCFFHFLVRTYVGPVCSGNQWID